MPRWTPLAQFLVEPSYLIAPVGKNNDALDGGVIEQIHKHGESLPTGNQIHLLIYRHCHPFRLNLDGDRFTGPLPRQIHNVLRKGGRKKQGLSIFLTGRGAHDALHLRNKPHIQHPIRFVQNQRFHSIQRQVTPFHKVDQSAGGRNDEINGCLVHFVQLLLVIRTANEGDRFQTGKTPQFGCIGGDLHNQFTRRRNDHARGSPSTAPVNGMVEQIVKDGNQEGSSFAGARLCLADGVITRKGVRQDATLNGRAKLKTQRIDAPLHGRVEIQRLKFYLFSGRGAADSTGSLCAAAFSCRLSCTTVAEKNEREV